MKKIIKLLAVIVFLLGTFLYANDDFERAIEHSYKSNYKEAIKFFELAAKKSNTGEAEKRLGMIYSGYDVEDQKYVDFINSLNLSFEDRMKLSEKYLLSAISKENIETSYIYLCYIYALQKKYDLSEEYFEKFREYYEKHNLYIDWMDARALKMTGNELKAALIYRIIIEDGKYDYPSEIIEELLDWYPPNYDVLIKYTLKSIESGNSERIGDLGRFYHKNKNFDKAETYYKIFIEIFSNKELKLNNLDNETKFFYVKELEKLLNEQGRKLDKEYVAILKELEKK